MSKYDRIILMVDDTQEYRRLINEAAVALGLKALTVSEEEAPGILELYRTYEFSDRFRVFERNRQMPSVFNLVSTGQITVEEAWRAFLS